MHAANKQIGWRDLPTKISMHVDPNETTQYKELLQEAALHLNRVTTLADGVPVACTSVSEAVPVKQANCLRKMEWLVFRGHCL